MTLDEAAEIFEHWARYPPTYQMAGIIAQILGYKPKPDHAVSPGPGQNINEIIASAPPGVLVSRDAAPLPFALLDEDELRERNRQKMIEIARRNVALSLAEA